MEFLRVVIPVIPLIFPKVPQSFLGISLVTPSPWTPPLKNPIRNPVPSRSLTASLPLKSYPAATGKDRLPTTIIHGYVKNFGGVYWGY